MRNPDTLSWIREQNTLTKMTFSQSELYESLHSKLFEVIEKQEEMTNAHVSFSEDFVWQMYHSLTHPRGLFRKIPLVKYLAKAGNHSLLPTDWETIIDVDFLSQKYKANWSFDSGNYLEINQNRWLIKLNRSGKDAGEWYEYDLVTKDIVPQGIHIPESKMRPLFIHKNDIYFALNPPTLKSQAMHNARIAAWQIGTPLHKMTTIYSAPDKGSVLSAWYLNKKQKEFSIIIEESPWRSTKIYLYELGERPYRIHNPYRVPISEDIKLLSSDRSYLYFILRKPLKLNHQTLPVGALVRCPLAAKNGDEVELILTTASHQSVQSISAAPPFLYVTLLNHSQSNLIRLQKQNGIWTRKTIPILANGNIQYQPRGYALYESYLEPKRSLKITTDLNQNLVVKELARHPHTFDSSQYVVHNHLATSIDGVKIPFTVIAKKNLIYNGKSPTILTAYGGFEHTDTPSYLYEEGPLWLEKGGIYVIAHVRGGGNYGPDWHQAAVGKKREAAIQDFIAVAKSLIKRKITSPQRLAIVGSSNGGLLVSSAMIKAPELFSAVVSEVALTDMLNYHKWLVGYTWTNEYGNPDNENDCEALLSYSPYHRVEVGAHYPPSLFITSSLDDRVHPAHSRKMVAALQAAGNTSYLYELPRGGHSLNVPLAETPHLSAIKYSFLWHHMLKNSQY